MKDKDVYSLVLGGYVNGYNIIKELYSCGLRNIALLDYRKSMGAYSNKIKHFKKIGKTAVALRNAIFELKKICEYIVIFPTDDLQLENLHEIYNDIKEFCFIPFNYDNVLESLDKTIQYTYCEKYNIPYPKTIFINDVENIKQIEYMIFPIIIKPNKYFDQKGVFRSLFLDSINDYKKNITKLEYFLDKKITFLASEYIPGDDTNMYSYVGYRDNNGNILNEWVGKKLTQFPDKFGVFSSASNKYREDVEKQGKKLLEVMDLRGGVYEPEFKYDVRDNKYKLMEITLRSTMWHRLGNISGVKMQYTQYLNALGKNIVRQYQQRDKEIHLVYMKHEIYNLIFRKRYWKHFKYNVFGGYCREFAVWDKSDVKPFLFDSLTFVRGFIGICLKILKLR